jgi:phosphoglycerol geranylgeranyltransferase
VANEWKVFRFQIYNIYQRNASRYWPLAICRLAVGYLPLAFGRWLLAAIVKSFKRFLCWSQWDNGDDGDIGDDKFPHSHSGFFGNIADWFLRMLHQRGYRMTIYEKLKGGSKKKFAVLVDPDKLDAAGCRRLSSLAVDAGVDFIFAGGSLVVTSRMEEMVSQLRTQTGLPVVLFPGNAMQVCRAADAILLLSLISGRNPDMLIGRHVEAASLVRDSGLEILPTGYMLVESGAMTTALYISNTHPIPASKPDVAACTALAGEQLGLKIIYLDGGSGALNPVSSDMIRAVRDAVSLPIIVGGGIRSPEQAQAACRAGADVIVVGNAIEEDAERISTFAQAIHRC